MKNYPEEKLVPKWQVTATTIYCDTVKNEATIMVYKDWSTACAYHKKWGPVRREKRKGIGALLAWLSIISDEKHIRVNGCEGPERCYKVLKYRDKLRREEEKSL